MNNLDFYETIKTPEGKYLMYLIDNLSNIEKNIESVKSSRDFKISSILDEELQEILKNIFDIINKVKSEINKIPTDVETLDNINRLLNELINYIKVYLKLEELS